MLQEEDLAYSTAGLADSLSNLPHLAWDELTSLAASHGIFADDESDSARRELATLLTEHFFLYHHHILQSKDRAATAGMNAADIKRRHGMMGSHCGTQDSYAQVADEHYNVVDDAFMRRHMSLFVPQAQPVAGGFGDPQQTAEEQAYPPGYPQAYPQAYPQTHPAYAETQPPGYPQTYPQVQSQAYPVAAQPRDDVYGGGASVSALNPAFAAGVQHQQQPPPPHQQSPPASPHQQAHHQHNWSASAAVPTTNVNPMYAAGGASAPSGASAAHRRSLSKPVSLAGTPMPQQRAPRKWTPPSRREAMVRCCSCCYCCCDSVSVAPSRSPLVWCRRGGRSRCSHCVCVGVIASV